MSGRHVRSVVLVACTTKNSSFVHTVFSVQLRSEVAVGAVDSYSVGRHLRNGEHPRSDVNVTGTTSNSCPWQTVAVPQRRSDVGVGAVVLNADDELLVVSERFQPKGFPETKLRFKLPGGHVDRQESLPDAVVREVVEKTGVPVKFDNVVCFRHNLEYPGGFGNGDMYFAARCSRYIPKHVLVGKLSRNPF